MIALLGASAVYLVALQATIATPTTAFRTCLKEASAKATTEKVASDAVDAYLRTACSAQLDTLKGALVAFSVKNGTGRKTAAADADMTVDDYLASSIDKYQYVASMNAPRPAPPAASAQQGPAATVTATPASAPKPPQP